ncbi:hypothetical protein CEW89_06505 [Celeribacter ethanolicus]|uniref:Uncharacterized protein n=1 Tax=Celeribacter ethanolicus TaxID=1758178 RepID=A0A291GB25_9RHOB|nr:hypothetical protein CEW89_06505 [Celeribacter ethanolicus]
MARTPKDRAAAFTTQHTEAEIRKFVKELWAGAAVSWLGILLPASIAPHGFRLKLNKRPMPTIGPALSG